MLNKLYKKSHLSKALDLGGLPPETSMKINALTTVSRSG